MAGARGRTCGCTIHRGRAGERHSKDSGRVRARRGSWEASRSRQRLRSVPFLILGMRMREESLKQESASFSTPGSGFTGWHAVCNVLRNGFHACQESLLPGRGRIDVTGLTLLGTTAASGQVAGGTQDAPAAEAQLAAVLHHDRMPSVDHQTHGAAQRRGGGLLGLPSADGQPQGSQVFIPRGQGRAVPEVPPAPDRETPAQADGQGPVHPVS